jgi:hypothetical protein
MFVFLVFVIGPFIGAMLGIFLVWVGIDGHRPVIAMPTPRTFRPALLTPRSLQSVCPREEIESFGYGPGLDYLAPPRSLWRPIVGR